MSTASIEQNSVDTGDPSNTGHSDELLQIVTFRLATEEYGVDVMGVQEIILIGRMTQLPQVPAYLSGLINLRGHIIPVIDLRKRFSLLATKKTDQSRVIILNIESRTIGIIVDEVNEVLRVNRNRIEKAPATLVGNSEAYMQGLVRLEKKLFILLNPGQLAKEVAMLETLPNAASN